MAISSLQKDKQTINENNLIKTNLNHKDQLWFLFKLRNSLFNGQYSLKYTRRNVLVLYQLYQHGKDLGVEIQ